MVWRSWQYCKACGLRECAWHLHEGTLQQPATLVLLREGVEGGPNACEDLCLIHPQRDLQFHFLLSIVSWQHNRNIFGMGPRVLRKIEWRI